MNEKQIQTVQSAINALDKLHQWLRHKDLGGLMPDEMQVLKDLRLMVNENTTEDIESLRKDAGRYQWIRHGDNDEIVMKGDCRGAYLPRNERLDAAIDEQLEIERMTVYLTQDHVMHGNKHAKTKVSE